MKRTRKVPVACMQCRRAHLSCSDVRPCERCVAKHIPHLCNDHSLQPEVPTLTEDEMQTISGILGSSAFHAINSSADDEFDIFQAANELDYTNIFLQDPATFLYNKAHSRTSSNPPSATPSSTPKRPIVRVSTPSTSSITNGTSTPLPPTPTPPSSSTINSSPHVHMVHGIIVNQPPPSYQQVASSPSPSQPPSPSPSPSSSNSPRPSLPSASISSSCSIQASRIRNKVIVHTPEDALSVFLSGSLPSTSTSMAVTPSIASTPSPPVFTTSNLPQSPLLPTATSTECPLTLSSPSPSWPSSPPLLTSSPSSQDSAASTPSPSSIISSTYTASPEYIGAVTSALAIRNEELQMRVTNLEEMQIKLQRALAEKDRQLVEMQDRQRQDQAKLKILLQCRVIPLCLDLTLVHKSKSYGIMTALYDITSGFVLDYNRNYERLLIDVYGPDLDVTRVKLPGGPTMAGGIDRLVGMMISDYFKESLEKYTYIRMPNGDKLPFLFSLSIQCWERPAGPLISLTYWL